VEKYTPLAAQVRAIRERFLFLEMVNFFGGGEERSCDGRGGAGSDQFGVLMSPKRQVRAAHGRAANGRARTVKTH
jgi:hypothetical protein